MLRPDSFGAVPLVQYRWCAIVKRMKPLRDSSHGCSLPFAVVPLGLPQPWQCAEFRVDHAPSVSLVKALLTQDVNVRVHDPKALAQLRMHVGNHPGLLTCDDPWVAVAGADALLVLTEWQIYRDPDFARLVRTMKSPVLLDGRNLYDPARARATGITYYGVGRR